MAETVQRIEYYYTLVPDRSGAGAQVLGALKAAGVSLLALNGFPAGAGQAQLDLVAARPEALAAAAKKAGVKLVGPKTAFLIQGEDRPGAVADVLGKLGQAGVSATAVQAVASGAGRYGAMLWVKPGDVARTAQALGTP